jgi:hypothetical protein
MNTPQTLVFTGFEMEAGVGIEPAYTALQSDAMNPLKPSRIAGCRGLYTKNHI